MTNGPIDMLDLANCKNDVERNMVRMETEIKVDIAGIKSDMAGMKQDMKDLKTDIEKLITRPEFEPVKMIAFGMAAAVLIAVLGAIISQVVA